MRGCKKITIRIKSVFRDGWYVVWNKQGKRCLGQPPMAAVYFFFLPDPFLGGPLPRLRSRRSFSARRSSRGKVNPGKTWRERVVSVGRMHPHTADQRQLLTV